MPKSPKQPKLPKPVSSKGSKFRLTGSVEHEHELELVAVDDNTQDTDVMGISEENAEPNLVQTRDGRLIIEMKVNRTCNVCNKTFASAKMLAKHQLICTDKLEEFRNVLEKEKVAAMVAQPGEEFFKYCNPNPDNPCYCCGEDISTAHVGHIKCKFCPKSFKAYEYMEKHLASVHAEHENFACPQCNAMCASRKVLEDHLMTHSEGKPFSCLKCGKDFTRKYHLDRHLNHSSCGEIPKQTLPCEVCGREFTRLDNLREHLRFHMGQGSRKRDYQCPYCPKSFYGSSLLNIHIRTHTGEKPFPCDLCSKSFPSTGALRKHRRSHTGERPYRCDECPATFAARETLNRHRKTHTGEKPHQCTVCSKRFIQATQLRAHMFNHTGENGFKCDQCGSEFNRKARLDEHVRYVHNKEKQLECEICSKEFVRKEDLNRHLDSHKSIRNFSCQQCEKTFVTKTAMKLHQRTHIVEEPSVCSICNKKFIRQDCVARHMRKKHRMIDSQSSENANYIIPDESTLMEVDDGQPQIEKDPQVLEIGGEVYQITPVENVQIVKMSSKLTNVKYEPNREIEIVDVVKITKSPQLESEPATLPVKKKEDSKPEIKRKRPVKVAKSEELLLLPLSEESVKPEPIVSNRKSGKDHKKNKRASNTDCQDLLVPLSEEPITPEPVVASKKERKKTKRASDQFDFKSTKIKIEDQDDTVPIFLSDAVLKDKISELLCLLIEEDTLVEIGWPTAPVEDVLSSVIRRCGHKPARNEEAGDSTTRMRENTKILFALTMDDANIKSLLNNHTVDEVIMNVLKNK
ncbi:protein suppressor of hairy wing [Topomyia yanbarensis]|uniref:protein suppressor of hairy wing n=1 Tax=Topomyia yanbarensis TaxID=2498891 RepID=UPI00273B09B1|nr:protein suppressor of hairy wing [Topomyia yanbarensis]XP_058813309.1 protein suppressor of hairy wing [Topomyia yanbarensis]